jgi:cytochrome P450
MRLFPPAPGIGRQARAAMELGGMPIAAGARVHIPVFALHRNALLWDNPNAFGPECFTADRVKARSHYTFCPLAAARAFASGPDSPPSRPR